MDKPCITDISVPITNILERNNMATTKKVKVTIDYDSDYENFLYEAGKEYEVDEATAKRLLEINTILRKENE